MPAFVFPPSEPVSTDAAVLTERRGRVLVITLNRPDAMNSINGALSHGVVDAIAVLEGDPELSTGVITGRGRGFCAGMDLKAFARGEDMGPMLEFIRTGSNKPLLAAVEGLALAGGLELALACDLIVAAEGAKLGIPEVTVGLFAAAGGLQRLPDRVGFGKAMELALTGDPISAEDAAGFGLVARVVPPGTALDAALALADRIARNAPLAVAASKQLIWAAVNGTERDFWEAQKVHGATVFASNDAREGPRAFAEKRPPNWTGS